MINLEEYISDFYTAFENKNFLPWEISEKIEEIILEKIKKGDDNFEINNGIAIHKTATIEQI